ncbi:hypothetical protein [Leucobacter manosquensis]|uniref:DUF3040 domain-containing protein n=1 Tax=Leucobacter manosquensis TaxID=2810611 RepID=A0ABS5M676_9MICO|nr:hypothetical protein [Leucobacter manosquensis]MBS3182355.1 hypothetical protein [Leucobacter manosquensis]
MAKNGRSPKRNDAGLRVGVHQEHPGGVVLPAQRLLRSWRVLWSMNRYALSRSRVDRVQVRREEAVAQRATAEQAVIGHAQEQRVFLIVQKKLSRLKGVKVTMTQTGLAVEKTPRLSWGWTFGVGSVVASVFAFAVWELAWAGFLLLTVGICLIAYVASVRRQSVRAIFAPGDSTLPRLTEWSVHDPRPQVRSYIYRKLLRQPGATVTDLPSTWDQLLKWVLRGA